MFNKIKESFYTIPVGLLLFWPSVTKGQESGELIPCEGVNCTFNDLFTLADNIVSFLTTYIAIPVATLAIVIGGIMWAINAANPAYIDKGKNIIKTALTGLFISLAAWLIVKFIVTLLVEEGNSVLDIFG
ncbi:MAG: pilin [Patescibacteria group bacterium]